jgi:cell division GTPase FtsZ
MGTGRATGEERAAEAALQAISSPLLENMSIEGAHGVLFNITGGTNLSLHEISEAASIIYEQAAEDANIIIGSVIDPSLTDEVIVTIIATGFEPKISQENQGIHTSVIDAPEAVKRESEVFVHVEQNVQAHKALQVALDAAEQLYKEEQAAQKLKPAQADHSADASNEAEHAETEEEILYVGSDTIDTNDLDVPTYLRNRSEQKEQK